MVDNKFLPKLSQNLLAILEDDEYYDVKIEVGNDPYVKVFHAHSVILYYRLPYLRDFLLTNKKKNDGILVQIIKFPNISPEIFQIILRYIYSGRLFLEVNDTSDIIKLLEAANDLNLQEIISHLQLFLIKNKPGWMEQNFNQIYQMSFKNDSFLELQKFCEYLITKEPDKIFKSSNYSSISEKLLISIIQNDNLQMSEVQVWEHVLNWGVAQNKALPSDIKDYSNDDFNALKNTLQHCIPFIKFNNLTSKEFSDKVLPYEEILPRELYKNLIKGFLSLLDPNSKLSDGSRPRITKEINSRNVEDRSRPYITKEINLRTIDSKIIIYQHAELISKWINRLEITDRLTSPYVFKLLLRGSRDGVGAKRFYDICNNQSRTVIFLKLRDSKEILGGYNPVEWKYGGGYSSTKDSFIFSFINENYILSRVKVENKAIHNSFIMGPSFGNGDLILWNIYSENYCRKTSYEKPIRNTENSFLVKECEVFSICTV